MMMLTQEQGWMVFNSVCVACGLLILGMAASQWRRLKTPDYGWMTMAAGVLLLGRGLGLLALWAGWTSPADCLEWTLEGLTLTTLVAAYLLGSQHHPRRIVVFLAVGALAVGGSAVLCYLLRTELLLFSWMVSPGLVVLLLLSGFGLLQWARYRRRFSLWLGGAFLVSLLGAASGLVGLRQATLLGHLVALCLIVVETYRSVVADLGAHGQELQTASEQTLHQSQELALLLELSQAITSSLDLPIVLERASEAVGRAVNADWAYVLLPVDDEAEELAVAARYGWWGRQRKLDAQVHRQVVIRLGDFSLLRHAVLRRRQVLANEPKDYEQFERLHDLLGRPQSGPTLVQPICLQEQVLGAVLLGYVGKQQTFSQADGRLCQALVMQVAMAIENARLYQSIDEQARRLAEVLRVREEEATQRQAILESISDGVVVAEENGEVVLVNDMAELILGMPRDRLSGQAIRRLYAELMRPSGRGTGDPVVFEWYDRVVTGSLSPVKMPDGGLLGYVAVFRDITRESQTRDAKSNFIASIAHQLRAPLMSLKGSVELLATGAVGSTTPQQKHFLETADENAEQLVGLVNNLIVVSDMERGSVQVESRPVDMGGVIQEAVQAVRARAAEDQLDLTLKLPPSLSPARGDAQALRQIMDNLLENAVLFTPADGHIMVWATEAHLENEGQDPQDYLVVSIRDTGVGIPLGEQGRIFDRFYRVENPLSVQAGGVGMGLAIVKSLIEAHGGQIWVESKPGQGSTFSFSIPALKAS